MAAGGGLVDCLSKIPFLYWLSNLARSERVNFTKKMNEPAVLWSKPSVLGTSNVHKLQETCGHELGMIVHS